VLQIAGFLRVLRAERQGERTVAPGAA